MQLQTVQLVLTVAYGYEDEPDHRPDEQTCRAMMHDLVSYAANRGLLSGEHDFVVDSHDHEVITLPHRHSECQRCGSETGTDGYCKDETCPFSDHQGHCPVGWAGHPEMDTDGECNCQNNTKYGVTWATEEDSLCQTGYEFNSIEAAKAAAVLGPFKQTTQVDYFTNKRLQPGERLFGRIECENDAHGEIEVPQENLKQ